MKKLKLLNKWSIIYLLLNFILGPSFVGITISIKFVVKAIENNDTILMPLLFTTSFCIMVAFLNIIILFVEKKMEISYENSLKQILLKHYSQAPFKSFAVTDFENRLLFDTTKIISDFMVSKIKVISCAMLLLVVTGGVSYISPLMLPIIIFANLFRLFCNQFLEKRSAKINLNYSENRTLYIKKIEDLLAGYDDVSSFSLAKNLAPLFLQFHQNYKNKNTKLGKKESTIFMIRNLIGTITITSIWLSLTLLTRNGNIAISSFIVFIGLNTFFWQVIQEFITSFYLVKSSQGLMNKAFAKIESKKSEVVKDVFPIETKKLAFNSKNQVINFKDLAIKSQEKILLKGKNGSGKSVFLKSLLERIDYEGEIRFNNKKLATKSIAHFAKYISTNPVILDCSIAKNILLNENATLNATFKETYAFLFNELPALDQNALKLSHGQKQIICLLRVLHKAPKLLIIDEAISGVAKKALAKIEMALAKLPFSIIYVSHQAKTNFQANRIILNGNNA